MKLYKRNELKKKFPNQYIDTYPHHYEYWNDKTNKYETVYEVRGVSDIVRENYQLVEEILTT